MDTVENLRTISALDESLYLVEVGAQAARKFLKEARRAYLERMPMGEAAKKIDEIVWKVRNQAVFLPRDADRVRSLAQCYDNEINRRETNNND